jgi:hypothetical protein
MGGSSFGKASLSTPFFVKLMWWLLGIEIRWKEMVLVHGVLDK